MGDSVGLTVGSIVGTRVGEIVGDNVGERVGCGLRRKGNKLAIITKEGMKRAPKIVDTYRKSGLQSR